MKTLKLFLFITLVAIGLNAEAKRISSSAETVTPLMNGQSIPNATVQDLDGNSMNLADIVKKKPTIVFFYRGGWCPYCNMQMGQLQQIEPELKEMGYQLIGISPDAPADLKKSVKERELGYQLLSDRNLEAMKGFGIAFYLAEDVAKKYRANVNSEFATDGGTDRIVLPAPAAYIFDTKGIVQFQYVNPNFKARVEPEVLKLAAKLALK